MKTSHSFAFAAAALVIGFLTARWCDAQPSGQPPGKEPASYDFGALQQYESFVRCLHDTSQTNILQQFNDYSNASMASQQYADLGNTLCVLKTIRDGSTDLACDLLEGEMGADIVGFAASYRQLPASLRGQTSLILLRQARDYHAKYPSWHYSQIFDDGVTNAFKILDEPGAK